MEAAAEGLAGVWDQGESPERDSRSQGTAGKSESTMHSRLLGSEQKLQEPSRETWSHGMRGTGGVDRCDTARAERTERP